MKKILLFLFVLFFISQSVFATNWQQYAEKAYVDIDSIEENPSKKGEYFFWIKQLNNKSNTFKDAEKSYHKKIWYMLYKYTVDCKEKKISVCSIVVYDLNNDVIDSEEFFYSAYYNSIVPDSIGELYYNNICPKK